MFMRALHTFALMVERVVVFGASGFSGAELLRLLVQHPGVELVGVVGDRSAGDTVASVLPWLAGSPVGALTIGAADAAPSADLALLALPHLESAHLAPRLVERGARVIDLSGAFRLDVAEYPDWYGFEHPEPAWISKAVYGLTERFRVQISTAELVANPGCFATGAVLALAPLLEAGAIEPTPIALDGKTGVSGAGRAATEATSFASTAESVRPYRTPRHQHTPEIERALATAAGLDTALTFVPHVVPAVRGILVTAFARLADGATTDGLTAVLEEAYRGEPFVRVLAPGEMADTQRVRGSNTVELQAVADPRTGAAVAIAALDNLGKGAAGQAIQNLNVMLGLDETTALSGVGIGP
jgi:N-acetyl-gamma-glutamyl-phosphate reductase